MEPCPRCSGFVSLLGRFDRRVWLVCRACHVVFAIDHAQCQEVVH
jgi:hypothetical protein